MISTLVHVVPEPGDCTRELTSCPPELRRSPCRLMGAAITCIAGHSSPWVSLITALHPRLLVFREPLPEIPFIGLRARMVSS